MTEEIKNLLNFELFFRDGEYVSRLETARVFTSRDLQVMIECMSISLTSLIKMQGTQEHNVIHTETRQKDVKHLGDGLE